MKLAGVDYNLVPYVKPIHGPRIKQNLNLGPEIHPTVPYLEKTDGSGICVYFFFIILKFKKLLKTLE